MRYSASRGSFIYNYVLVLLLAIFIFLVLIFTRLKSFTWMAIACLAFIAMMILLLEPEYERIYKYYQVEEDNLAVVEGIFVKKRLSIPYRKITDTTVTRTVLGRILNFGDITASGINNKITMKGMRNPYRIYQKIQEKLSSLARPEKGKSQQ